MSLLKYIHHITGRIFKIIVLKETYQREEEPLLDEYVDSMIIEMKGATRTFPVLERNEGYISVINTLNGLRMSEITMAKCRREVFKMCNLLNKIEREADSIGE